MITFGSATCNVPTTGAEPGTSWQPRGPTGVDVPSYISGATCGSRYCVRAATDKAYDTIKLPAVMYPLDGNRYVVGHDARPRGR